MKTTNRSASHSAEIRGDRPQLGHSGRPGEPAFGEARSDVAVEADRILLDRYAPGAVVVNDKLQVVLYRGNTGRYLEQSPGKPGLDLRGMVPPGIVAELEYAFERARKERVPARIESLQVRRDADPIEINLEVIPLGPPSQTATHFLVVFEGLNAPRDQRPEISPSSATERYDNARDLEVSRLRRELSHTLAYLRSNTQKHAARDAELTALNGETLSSNEELQRMNEELEAAKEELQAGLEELVALNDELRCNNAGLSRLNDEIRDTLERTAESGAYAEAVVETVRHPLIVLDGELRVQGANPAFCRALDKTPEQTIGKRIEELGGEWADAELQTLVRQALSGRSQEYELEGKGRDRRSLLVHISPIRISGKSGPLALLAVDDVTAQKQALEVSGIRHLSARLQEQLEAEWNGIARQVHDDLGQDLTALRRELSALKTTPEPWGAKLPRAIAAIQSAIQTAREIATELRPPFLDQFGLKAAIEWQLEACSRRTGIRTTLAYDLKIVPPDPDLLTALVKVLQEAVSNVARHAQASLIEVTLRDTEGYLVLEIADNGVGIDMAKLSDPRSLGLSGMRERCAAHGGQLSFVNRGHGTILTAELPVPLANPKDQSLELPAGPVT